MERIISVVVRSEDGKLRIKSDKKEILCSPSQVGLDQEYRSAIAEGNVAVLILAEDDSVLRHWVAPETQSLSDEVLESLAAESTRDAARG